VTELDQLYQKQLEQFLKELEDRYTAFKADKSDWKKAFMVRCFIRRLNVDQDDLIEKMVLEEGQDKYKAKSYNRLKNAFKSELVKWFEYAKTSQYEKNVVQHFVENDLVELRENHRASTIPNDSYPFPETIFRAPYQVVINSIPAY